MPRLDVGNHGGSFRKDLNGGNEIGERQEAEPDSPQDACRRLGLDSVSAEGTNKGANVGKNQ